MVGLSGLVDAILRSLVPQRTYNGGGHLQWAVAERLESGLVVGGECAPFLLVPVPLAYQRAGLGPAAFRYDTLVATGVMLSDAWPLARASAPESTLSSVRMYLGCRPTNLTEALDRMAAAGVRYDMAVPAGGGRT